MNVFRCLMRFELILEKFLCGRNCMKSAKEQQHNFKRNSWGILCFHHFCTMAIFSCEFLLKFWCVPFVCLLKFFRIPFTSFAFLFAVFMHFWFFKEFLMNFLCMSYAFLMNFLRISYAILMHFLCNSYAVFTTSYVLGKSVCSFGKSVWSF